MSESASQLYWDILDQPRKDILPSLTFFRDAFYLAGGTGLSLQLGHRDSIDFDFFTPDLFDTVELFHQLEHALTGHEVLKTQEDKNTLSGAIDTNIKFSFFSYPYPLLSSLIETDHLRIASIEDIGCMKLSAITSRSVLKDYVDLYFILHKIELDQLLGMARQKLPAIDTNLMLKSLVYFDDIQEEPIMFKHDDNVSLDTVKEYLSKTVKDYLSQRPLTD